MPDHPGWPLRNLLALIAHSCPRRIFRERLTVICLRQKAKDVGVSSIVLTLEAHGGEKIEQLSGS